MNLLYLQKNFTKITCSFDYHEERNVEDPNDPTMLCDFLTLEFSTRAEFAGIDLILFYQAGEFDKFAIVTPDSTKVFSDYVELYSMKETVHDDDLRAMVPTCGYKYSPLRTIIMKLRKSFIRKGERKEEIKMAEELVYVITKSGNRIPVKSFKEGKAIKDPFDPFERGRQYVVLRIDAAIDENLTSERLYKLYRAGDFDKFSLASPTSVKSYDGYTRLYALEEFCETEGIQPSSVTAKIDKLKQECTIVMDLRK